MKIHLISIGKSMPAFINQGFSEYQKRMPRDFELILHEQTAIKRTGHTHCEAIKQQESLKLLEKIPAAAISIALDPQGKVLTTEQFSAALKNFYEQHQDIAFLIGGPEGLSASCLKKMRHIWSLSHLTFPHSLVRVILAEQLYRAMTLLKGLPYHR
jgi:23S rRNA (pseudouridine1915-N3)-methyltransferase